MFFVLSELCYPLVVPTETELFQDVIKHYFSLRRSDNNVLELFKELRAKKVSLYRFVKFYNTKFEYLKKEEIKIFGMSGDGWSQSGIVRMIIINCMK